MQREAYIQTRGLKLQAIPHRLSATTHVKVTRQSATGQANRDISSITRWIA